MSYNASIPEAVDMNGRFQMQGGKNWFLPKEMNANRFFWDSHWLEIWSNHFYPSMGPNGGSVAMDSAECAQQCRVFFCFLAPRVKRNAAAHCKLSFLNLLVCNYCAA